MEFPRCHGGDIHTGVLVSKVLFPPHPPDLELRTPYFTSILRYSSPQRGGTAQQSQRECPTLHSALFRITSTTKVV